jgi:hypothetical protein
LRLFDNRSAQPAAASCRGPVEPAPARPPPRPRILNETWHVLVGLAAAQSQENGSGIGGRAPHLDRAERHVTLKDLNARVEVQAHNLPSAHALGRKPGHDAGAACDVEDPLARRWSSPLDQVSGLERCDRRDKVALVEVCGAAIELPGLVLGHVDIRLGQCTNPGGGRASPEPNAALNAQLHQSRTLAHQRRPVAARNRADQAAVAGRFRNHDRPELPNGVCCLVSLSSLLSCAYVGGINCHFRANLVHFRGNRNSLRCEHSRGFLTPQGQLAC